ncbi:MAG TPA: ABC transporter substrate-binding protein [Gaiellaceae bacterium]|nr:ABC transporter substrate-binding protein [Gaiellaceae bacterium]
MHRRLWLSVTMLVAGASLLVAASFASAGTSSHKLKQGGIWKYGTEGASVQVDPQLAYITTAWWLEYATAAKLYNYPDKAGAAGTQLKPEVASKFTVSRDGKTYTFTIRKGFRFSNGAPVTANNFKYAINRTLNKDLASPGAQFITDSAGTNIVGGLAVNNGKAKTASGVKVKGNKLIVRLTKPDATFMAKITMPFFQATSTSLPLTKEVVTVKGNALPSAGPYYYSRNDVNSLTSLRRNKFYKAGAGRTRPHNLTGLDVLWNQNEATLFNETKANQVDENNTLPPDQIAGLKKTYKINRSRFWVQPQNCTGYLPMNMANSLFKGNTQLRQAVNYAIDRAPYVGQSGPLAGSPWTHVLNPNVPGWQNVSLYKHDLAKAKNLAKGHMGNGKITVYYRSSGSVNPAQAQIVRNNLIQIGFNPSNITMKGFSGGNIYTAMGVKGNDADIGVSMGWCSDYPDPYDWLNILFYGPSIQSDNNVNYSYMNVPKWNTKLAQAAKMVGPNRYKTYGKLDIDIMKQVAPVAVTRTYNTRYFFSTRVNPKSLVFSKTYADFSIGAMALK